MEKTEGLLYLADGTFYRGKGFGAPGTAVGELVFNTSMTGYQGILTDPSYAGQIINMTYPLIGNYGVSDIDYQSEKIHAFGFVTRDITFRPSNRSSVMSIDDWLTAQGIPGIYNVDTRSVTKKIRKEGTVACLISNEAISRDEARELLERTPLRDDYNNFTGTREIVSYGGSGHKIAVLDFGIKRNIIKGLTDLGCAVTLYPYGTTAEDILAASPDGLFLSNGPGDPQAAQLAIKTVKELAGRLPIGGICLGHQIIALALGGNTYKLKFGHRGANHGVIDLTTDSSAITSQNHSFAVDESSLKGTGLVVTHLNLNDATVEGIRHEELPIFSVQYHPEGSPGPNDSSYLFKRYTDMVAAAKGGSSLA